MSAPVLRWLLALLVFLFPIISINARVAKSPGPLNPESRIIGGQKAIPHSAPFMAHLIMKIPNDANHIILCGGTLISHKYVITAAHCLIRVKIKYVLLGADNINARESEQKIVKAARYFIQDEYDGISESSRRHDLAIIELATHVTFNNYIRPLALPRGSALTRSYVGEKVRAYGWGTMDQATGASPDHLYYVDLFVVPVEQCMIQQNCVFGNVYSEDICVTDYKRVGAGDSGGPLVFNNTLIGVTSAGSAHSYCGKPHSLFTGISNYIDWIQEHTDLNLRDVI